MLVANKGNDLVASQSLKTHKTKTLISRVSLVYVKVAQLSHGVRTYLFGCYDNKF